MKKIVKRKTKNDKTRNKHKNTINYSKKQTGLTTKNNLPLPFSLNYIHWPDHFKYGFSINSHWSNMESKYEVFRRRKSQRIKAIFGFVLLLVSFSALAIVASIYARWLYGWTVIAAMLSFVIAFLYVMSKPWAFEFYETDAFVDFYEAFKLLEPCSEKDVESLSEGKAANKVKQAIADIHKWKYKVSTIYSKLVRSEYTAPLEELEDKLQARILPRIAQHKDVEKMKSVLKGLAKMFSEAEKPIVVDDIIAKNKDLEEYKPVVYEEKHLSQALAAMMTSKPMKFLCSILLGYLSITVVFFVIASFLSVDFIDTMRNNIGAVMTGGALFTTLIIGLIITRK
jgi:hypothetical protein